MCMKHHPCCFFSLSVGQPSKTFCCSSREDVVKKSSTDASPTMWFHLHAKEVLSIFPLKDSPGSLLTRLVWLSQNFCMVYNGIRNVHSLHWGTKQWGKGGLMLVDFQLTWGSTYIKGAVYLYCFMICTVLYTCKHVVDINNKLNMHQLLRHMDLWRRRFR